MPQYVEAYGQTIEFPDGMTPDQISAAIRKSSLDIPRQNAGLVDAALDFAKRDIAATPGRVGNLAAGALRGAGSIGATLLAPFDIAEDALRGRGLSLESNRQRRADMTGGLQSLGADPTSPQFQFSKLGTEIAGTLGVGGLLGNVAGRVLPNARPAINALRTGGFRTGGGLSPAADMATRIGAGAAVGGAAAGLVNPDDTLTGIAVGGALPPAAKLVGKAGQIVLQAWRSARTPQEVKIAQKLAQQLGVTADDIAAATTGPQMIPGYQPTLPQIVLNPVASQLQRTLKSAGANALGDAERVQQGQFRDALGRVAPIDVSVQDAASRAGSAIQDFAMPARQQASTRVRAAFDAVDPFGESQLFLPMDEMGGAVSKFLGPGTFGTGARAREAVRTAQEVGSDVLPAVKKIPQSAGKTQSLEQAVRGMGGIKPSSYLSGEINSLRPRESGTTGLFSKSGKDADWAAQVMYERGFIPDADPATLLEALRNGGGRKVFANDATEGAFQRMAESAMGDAPGATVIPKTVPFQTVQNLRSSIGEAAEQASAKGANKEAAALRKMVAEIDFRVNRAAGGSKQVGEFFPADMADQYRAALDLHAQKMRQFETGPQVGMFRKGADGQPAIQGAEIPGKFFSGRRSQVEDMQAFKRLIGDREDLAQEMKRFAVTEGYGTSNQAGDLTSKFLVWMRARSGANAELFNPQEMATLREVGKAVERALAAENLGRVSGSDTAQKLASLNSNGLLDNRVVDMLARRIPLLGSFTGPALDGLRASATQSRQGVMAGLLADPARMESALRTPGRGLLEFDPGALDLLTQGAYRTLPVLAGDRGAR